LLVSVRRVVRLSLLSIVGLLVLIQLVPYGRDHTNPPASAEPAWDSARTRALADAACFDCHSNETRWPWYTNVAPFSWLTQNDVDNGREALNFSEWDRPQEAEELAEVISDGEMPPWYYRLLHSAADLSDREKQQLIDGLRATLRASPAIED
jgi:hypothetical protein